jgi:hypothetical protein
VDGCAGNTAFAGDLEEGHSCILDQEGKDLLVGLINVIAGHNLRIITMSVAKIEIIFKKE